MTITLTSITDEPETTVDLKYKGASQVDGKTKFSVDLIANKPVTISSKMKITDAEWEVQAVAEKVKDKDTILGAIDTKYSKRQEGKTSSAKAANKLPENLKVIKAIEAPDIPTTAIPPALQIDGKKNMNQNSSALGQSIISGSFSYFTKIGDYRDISDTLVPAKNFLVQIVDGNGNHIAFGYTDVDGHFSVPITNPGSTGIQVRWRSYVKYSPYDYELMTIVPGGTGWADTHYVWAGTFLVPDGNVDIGGWWINQGEQREGAFWIKDDLDRAFSSIPQQPGPGIVEWSYTNIDGTYYRVGGHIYLKGEDRASPDTVIHEYGHNVMYNIYYGNWFPRNDCPSPHYIQEISGINCGWTEGWADFFPLYVNGNPIFTWASGAYLDLEIPTWGTLYWNNGDQVEGRVAGALWDIYDGANDGTDFITDGIGNIWYTIYHQKDDGYANDKTFPQYWDALKSRYVSTQGARAALYQNTIDYNTAPIVPNNPSPSNGATNQPTGQTLSWKGGDSDLDIVTYAVYLDINSNPTIQKCQGTSITCPVSGLSENTLFYWKVVASDGMETTIGPIWNFRTLAGNNPPNIPKQLAQYKSDGVTGVSLGGTTTENTIVAKGGVSDTNSDTVQLEVEVKPIGTAFTNTPNCVSGLAVSSGSTASTTCSGLANGQYHWHARTKDEHGAVGSWLSAGGNPESNPDFIVDMTTPILYGTISGTVRRG